MVIILSTIYFLSSGLSALIIITDDFKGKGGYWSELSVSQANIVTTNLLFFCHTYVY